MLQPRTKLISTYMESHVAEIFLHVFYNWEAASATSASTSYESCNKYLSSKKKRAPGEKGLGTTLKKMKSLCFNIHIHISGPVKFFTQRFGWGAAKSHGTSEGTAGGVSTSLGTREGSNKADLGEEKHSLLSAPV